MLLFLNNCHDRWDYGHELCCLETTVMRDGIVDMNCAVVLNNCHDRWDCGHELCCRFHMAIMGGIY